MNYNDSSVETGRRHYYSSSQGPFYNANNIFMFYGGGDRGKTVENIFRMLGTDGQIVHVHGERGSGKTMVSLVISDRLKHRCNIVRYDIPEMSASLLLRHLLIELCPQRAELITAEQALEGVESEAIDIGLNTIINHLFTFGSDRSWKPIVLIVDSQAEMDSETLRVLEVLSDLKVADQFAFQCLVFHRVEDEIEGISKVQHDAHYTSNHFWLRRLTLLEVNEYLHHHMLLFDFNRRDLFTREMAYFIADRSEGVFRSINTLARNAFTIANLEDAEKLSMSHLLAAGLPSRSKVSIGSSFMARHRSKMIALVAACVVASAMAAVYFMR